MSQEISKKYVARGKVLNPKKLELTHEILKTFNGFENCSTEELNETVETVNFLSALLYEYAFSEGTCAKIPILKAVQKSESIFQENIAA